MPKMPEGYVSTFKEDSPDGAGAEPGPYEDDSPCEPAIHYMSEENLRLVALKLSVKSNAGNQNYTKSGTLINKARIFERYLRGELND